MRAFALLMVALALAGCASRFDGQDGMDGRAVAAVLRSELQNADR